MKNPFTLYLAGAEIPGWKKLLEEFNSPMAISFKGLRRRMPKTKPYLLAERFEGEYPLLLDSGAHSFNSAKSPVSRDELLDHAAQYEAFVASNIDRVTLVSEFDALALGREWVEERRRAFYDLLDPAKFMPVWHEPWGLDTLQKDASTYEVLGVGITELATGRNLQAVLHSLARAGVHLHGVALTKPDILRTIPFASASSTSWLSPIQYGDTIVWDGQQLHRYPRDAKDRARRQHKMLIERAGFDADAIIAGDATETARFTVWSWMQQAAAIAQHRRPGVPRASFQEPGQDSVTDTSTAIESGEETQEGGVATVTTLPAPHNSKPVPDVRNAQPRASRVTLPILGVETLTSEEVDSDCNTIKHERNLVRAVSGSGRVCDNCYLAQVCPLYQPEAECAYDIPVEARTAEQRRAIMEGIIEMQTQRVAFLKYAEDRNGGYADPNLSTEMDRLFKLISVKSDVEDDRDSFEMTIKSKGRATTLERIFGQEAPPRHGAVVDSTAVDPLRALDSKVSLQ